MFEFLNSITPVVVEQEIKVKKTREKVSKNPEGMRLRIYKDGSVYPSQELVDKFELEYLNKDSSAEALTSGFDVFSSKDWVQYPKGEDVQQFVFIAPVDKNLSKISLFGSVDYNTDGTPKKSVMNQGSKRPEIVEMLREVYNLKERAVLYGEVDMHGAAEMLDFYDALFGSKNYVDLDVNTEVKVFEGLPKYFIPKKMVKGPKAGQMSYVERTSLNIHPLTIVNTVVGEDEIGNQEELVLEESV